MRTGYSSIFVVAALTAAVCFTASVNAASLTEQMRSGGPGTGAPQSPTPPPQAQARGLAQVLADRNGNRISDGFEDRLAGLAAADPVNVIVTFSSPGNAASAARAVGPFDLKTEFRVIPGFAATMRAGQARALANTPGVFRVEEDAKIYASNNASRHSFGVDAAFSAFGYDGSGIDVCVIDSGIMANHEQFDSKSISFCNARTGGCNLDLGGNPITDSPIVDDHGHGSHVAGTIAGDGTEDVPSGDLELLVKAKGVAPAAGIASAKVLSSSGEGEDSDAIKAIDWCVAHAGVRAINMSIGVPGDSDGADALSQAVNAAVNLHDVTVVVAAGNEGDAPHTIGSPAAAAEAITVGALSGNPTPSPDSWHPLGIYRAPFSSAGPTLDLRIKPDIMGPGVNVASAYPVGPDVYTVASGTSMATPFVTGVVALMLDADPTLTAAQVRNILTSTAIDVGPPGTDPDWGAGLVDAYAAVATAHGVVGPTPHAFPTFSYEAFGIGDFTMIGGVETAQVPIEVTDTSAPLAITILLESGGSPRCALGFCEWNPDLDTRLLNPADTLVAASSCPADINCASPVFVNQIVGRQETLIFQPIATGTYTLEVFPAESMIFTNNPAPFTVVVSKGPIGTPPPGNTPPVAGDDPYETNEDTTLNVAAPGVLGNDTDDDGDSLAVLPGSVSDPANGSVTLNVDGSFEYVPDPDFFGVDTFTYQAEDGYDTSNVATVTVTVNSVNDPPVAALGYSCTGLTCDFDATGSTDPDGSITYYAWDFGDSNSTGGATETIPSHTYATPGTYPVTLTVTDNDTDTDDATTNVTVGATASTLGIADLDGSAANAGKNWTATVVIAVADNLGSPVENATVGGSWTGSVTEDCTTNAGGTCSITSPSTPKKTGSLVFTVTDVSHGSLTYDSGSNADPDGDSTGTMIQINKDGTTTAPGNQSPIASFTYDCSAAPLCTFDASGSSDPEGGALTYGWDFGDSSTGSGATPSHTYGGDGSYTVVLTVTDDASASDTDTQVVTLGTGGTVSVSALTPSSSSGRPGRWNADVLIAVTDALEGVVVTGSWSNGAKGSVTCTTGPSGNCGVRKANLKTSVTNVTFTVDDLGLTGYTYDPGGNVVTSVVISAP